MKISKYSSKKYNEAFKANLLQPNKYCIYSRVQKDFPRLPGIGPYPKKGGDVVEMS